MVDAPKILEKDFIGLNGVGKDQLNHPHFEIWQKYFIENYKIKEAIKIILFLPCAAIKPYYNSPIHRVFNDVIEKYKNIQKFVISIAGIIPYEFCDRYPFDSYDWNPLFETEAIKEDYIDITSNRIKNFFESKKVDSKMNFIAYLRNDSESLKSLDIAFNKLKLKFEVIKIFGELHETADTDLLLILKDNLIKLEEKLKSLAID